MNSNQFASNEAMAQARAHVDSFAEGDRVVNVRTGKVGTFVKVVPGYGGQPWFGIAFDGDLYRFEADLTMVMPEAIKKADGRWDEACSKCSIRRGSPVHSSNLAPGFHLFRAVR
jgi:hypothetical protein